MIIRGRWETVEASVVPERVLGWKEKQISKIIGKENRTAHIRFARQNGSLSSNFSYKLK